MVGEQTTATLSSSNFSIQNAEPVDSQVGGPSDDQSAGWRAWVVKWDIPHNIFPLDFFALYAMENTASNHYGMANFPSDVPTLLLFTS